MKIKNVEFGLLAVNHKIAEFYLPHTSPFSNDKTKAILKLIDNYASPYTRTSYFIISKYSVIFLKTILKTSFINVY